MKVSGTDIESNINNIKAQIEADNTLSPSIRTAMDLLLLIVTLLCQRLVLNINNSIIPPGNYTDMALQGDRVLLTGKVVDYMRGKITLSPLS
jgi:hypothetical protein